MQENWGCLVNGKNQGLWYVLSLHEFLWAIGNVIYGISNIHNKITSNEWCVKTNWMNITSLWTIEHSVRQWTYHFFFLHKFKVNIVIEQLLKTLIYKTITSRPEKINYLILRPARICLNNVHQPFFILKWIK